MRDEIADVEMTIGGLFAAIEAGANTSTVVDRLRELGREGFTYPLAVADRAVRTVCHQFEKMGRLVPTK